MDSHQALREKVAARNKKQRQHGLDLQRRTKVKSLLAGLAASRKRRSAQARVQEQVTASTRRAAEAKQRALRAAARSRRMAADVRRKNDRTRQETLRKVNER